MLRKWGGPFPTHRNGEPHLNRSGEPWEADSPLTYKAPCCELHNDVLNRRFERHKPEVVAFLERRDHDPRAVGEWWLKTLLLFVHPETVETMSTAPMIVYPHMSETQDLYGWMVDGSLAPSDLRLFCALAPHPDEPEPERDVMQSVWLRSWTHGSQTRTPSLRHFGLANVQFQLIYAPGYDFGHPASSAHELWPPNTSRRFTNDGTLNAAEQSQWRNAFYASGHVTLAPDGESPLTAPLDVSHDRRVRSGWM